jgi:di/tricarboxylate transporter
MSFAFWYTLLLLVLMSVILVKEWLEAELIIVTVLFLLIVAKIITLEEAFAGFSNVGILAIGGLFIVVGGLESTGALRQMSGAFFGSEKSSIAKKLLRTLVPVAAISAFLNNTPVVAMMISTCRSWTEKTHYPLSKFLIPISYAAILGGMCTLIGTSTNLVVHGMLIKNGQPGLSFFELTKIGVPVTLFGVLFIVCIGHRLLPARKEPIVELGESTREFVIELKVAEEYENVGKTIEQAGLRHLTGLFLFQIERNGKVIAPTGPYEKIFINDRLFFTGLPKTILELQKTPGLQLLKDSTFDLKQYDSDEIKTFEVVISPSSPLIGENVRESNFREKYGSVIIAIHRNGERVKKKIGDVILHPGDTLLLLSEKNFFKKWYHSNDFYLISTTALGIPSKARWQVQFSIAVLIGMVLLATLEILPLVTAAGLAAVSLVVSRCVHLSEVKNMVNWRVLIIIASAFGISAAIRNSGIADLLAHQILLLGEYFGSIGILIGLYAITNLYTNLITNNATAALFFPVALSIGLTLNAEVRPFAITVAVAASANFATPIGYQTNMMVYGPGGYKFKDFLKIGAPLQFLIGILAVILIYYFYF